MGTSPAKTARRRWRGRPWSHRLGYGWFLASTRQSRRSLLAQLARPANLFQPHIDTAPDRYPAVFALLADEIGGRPGARVLSFGCSNGDEVFSLRRYLPRARVRGLDINWANVRECRARQRACGDPMVSFARAGSADQEPAEAYDAVLAMAVLRHGDLSDGDRESCAGVISFEAFEATVTGLARCVKPGGLLLIEHSNFRFTDTAVSAGFRAAVNRPRGKVDHRTPLYGPDNRRLEAPAVVTVGFRKLEVGPGRPQPLCPPGPTQALRSVCTPGPDDRHNGVP